MATENGSVSAAPGGADTLLVIGTITRPHSLHGEVRVHFYSDTPERYAALESFVVTENGTPGVLEVVSVRRHQDVYLFRFKGYDDRTDAERLRSVDLYVSREVLEAPAEGEYYYSDLKGLSVRVSGSQECFGCVADVFDTGANAVITVAYREGERDRQINVPFIEEAVDDVSIAGGFITVKEMYLRT